MVKIVPKTQIEDIVYGDDFKSIRNPTDHVVLQNSLNDFVQRFKEMAPLLWHH